ncbi:unnamed protein product [Onchocerca flexuosa]|uniref:Transposase n=1 Tax=Onchocerca flexuosa TaxID=387005 RepID=A0A183HEY4_9BILA|nr:unnamed protein product [Onchocerca flexuosa]
MDECVAQIGFIFKSSGRRTMLKTLFEREKK